MPTQANYCGHLYNFPGYGLHIVRTGGPTKGQIVPVKVNPYSESPDDAVEVGRPLTHADGSPVILTIHATSYTNASFSLDELAQLVEHNYTVEREAKFQAAAKIARDMAAGTR